MFFVFSFQTILIKPFCGYFSASKKPSQSYLVI
jgi:hypothetical protein